MNSMPPGSPTRLISRRHFVVGLTASFGLGAVIGFAESQLRKHVFGSPFTPFWGVLDQVIPPDGIRTTVTFGSSVQELIAAGAIDPEKLRAAYGSKPGMPGWLAKLIVAPSSEPIILSMDTAPHLLNLLWPLGLSTRTRLNEKSPLNTKELPSFASTGGWTLGRQPNGAAYFNKVASVSLTDKQEEKVQEVAMATFRPCCDNSTFFQDCNHGSALLGLIELGAAQGMTSAQLYRLSLDANTLWFPNQYVKTALYFALFEGREWNSVDPRLILGRPFSTLSGWQQNVNAPIQLANFLPPTARMTQAGCGIGRRLSEAYDTRMAASGPCTDGGQNSRGSCGDLAQAGCLGAGGHNGCGRLS